ncbi:MAG: glycosyltransferase family 4 protein [Coriobacteriia bacterium]|nr:glycosyltransferase family 4 protein [Coriobacteriia bacterium]
MPDLPVPGLPVVIEAASAHLGATRYARGLVSGLLQLPLEVRPRLTLVVAPGQTYFSERRQKVRVVTLARDPRSAAGQRELSQAVRQLAPAVLHCTSPLFGNPHVKVPLVTTLQSLGPLIVNDPVMPAASRRAFLRAVTRTVKASRALIVASRYLSDDTARLFPAAADKLSVIPQAADDFVMGEKQTMPDLMHRLPPTQFFLAMGNPRAHKSLPVALHAFGRFFQLASALPGFDAQACPRLLLIGKDRPGYLKAQLTGPSLDMIHFTGPVKDEELRWFYAHTLAFIAPSSHESSGLSPLEAASFATPVLAAHAGSLPEIFGEDAQAGAAYFTPDDPEELALLLLRIARDQDFVDKLSAAAYHSAERFTWRASAEATLALYHHVSAT